MKKLFTIVLVAVIVLLGLSYFFQQMPKTEVTVTPTSSPTPSEQPSVQSTPDTSTLAAGGSSYSHPSGLYTFLYPNDYAIEQEDPNAVRIFKRGEQQRPQSEMSDGVIMVFEPVALEGKTLDEWVDARIQQSLSAGTAEVVQPKTAMTFGMYRGYSFELRGLGSAKYLILQNSPNSEEVLVITTLVEDPQNKGYQKEVDATLATVELHR